MDRAKDFKKFTVLMAMLGENFNMEISKLKHDLYFNALEDFSIQELERAVYLAIKSLKFFPKVAEVRELIEGSADDRALLAWRIAVDTINHYHGANFVDDPAIAYCIQEIWGSYITFTEQTLQDLKFQEKRFLDLYKLTEKRPDLLIGISGEMEGWFQLQNRINGFLEWIPPIPKIETICKETKKIGGKSDQKKIAQ